MNIPFARDSKDAAMFDIDDTLISSKTGERIEDVYTIYKKIIISLMEIVRTLVL